MKNNQEQIEKAINDLISISGSPSVSKSSKKVDLADDIFNRIVSTRYRKSTLDSKVADSLRKYIGKAVSECKPIKLYFMVGGYKQARIGSAPHVNWAEIFSIHLASSLATEIAAIYDPGVSIIYRTHDVLMPFLNNYTEDAIEIYKDEFNKLLSIFDNKKNVNIHISQESSGSLLSKEKILPILENKYDEYLNKFNQLPEYEKEAKILKSYRNQCWIGKDDLTFLSEDQKRERSLRAALLDEIFLDTDPITSNLYPDSYIPVYFRKSPKNTRLYYGSCFSSAVQFWAGEGMIVLKKDRIIPTIFSFNQLNELNYTYYDIKNNPFSNVIDNSIKIVIF